MTFANEVALCHYIFYHKDGSSLPQRYTLTSSDQSEALRVCIPSGGESFRKHRFTSSLIEAESERINSVKVGASTVWRERYHGLIRTGNWAMRHTGDAVVPTNALFVLWEITTEEKGIMKNLEIDADKLSIPARQTLALIDEYIDIMGEHSVIMKAGLLSLYWEMWDELDGSISYQSGREFNLKDFTYRGLRIVSWDGE